MKFDINVLLDRSGSMSSRRSDHIGGLRTFVSDQKAQGETDFTLVQFDSENPFEVMFDAVPIESVNTDEINLVPRGGTPLLDAVGKTIAKIEERKHNKENVQVILMIITDGQENQSTEWTRERIKEVIQSKENDWKILYLGANVNAFGEAGGMGIPLASSANYANNSVGTAAVYNVNARKMNTMRSAYNQGLEKISVLCSDAANYTSLDSAELMGEKDETV